MYVLLLVAILCSGPALAQVQVPCYGGGCINVTVYLGPRWGSRVVMAPRTLNSTSRTHVPYHEEVKVSEDRVEHNEIDEEGLQHRPPQHRPVPQDGVFQVDFTNEESSPKISSPGQPTTNWYKTVRWAWWNPPTTRRPSEYYRTIPTNRPNNGAQIFDEYDTGTLDLSWRGYTGDGVKQALLSLSVSDRRKVTKLILDGNRIQHLPVLVFPVELEYGLEELSLNRNPISYLDSFTRFELSRLSRLRALNMSNCGLRSLEMPYLPSLEVLDLSANELTLLPPSLGRLSNLLHLFLLGNRLSYIYDTPLSSLTKLWVLDLSDNGLQEFWGYPLANLRYLVTLKLDNNLLRSLPLLNFEKSKVVSFANNTLHCSCDLVHWMKRQNWPYQDEYSETCQDADRTLSLHELRMWPERHQHLCEPAWWGKRLLGSIEFLYHSNKHIFDVSYKVVGVVVQIVLVTTALMFLVVLLKKRRKLMGKVKSRNIPYNKLDEQQVSTVSGPLHNV